MPTLTVSLTSKQAARLKDAVAEIMHPTVRLSAKLRLWQQCEELRALELAHPKRAYDEGMASHEKPLMGALEESEKDWNVIGFLDNLDKLDRRKRCNEKQSV